MVLELLRTYYPKGVNGELWCNDSLICYCIELPWRDNVRSISCISEGEYLLEKRYSKRFGNHLLVKNVKARDLILIHPGNVATRDLRGCISPVMKLTSFGEGLYSRVAMARLLEVVQVAFDRGEEVRLVIKG